MAYGNDVVPSTIMFFQKAKESFGRAIRRAT
jgi:hypothetical protein